MAKFELATGVILCMLLTKSLASKFNGLNSHVGRCLNAPGVLGNFSNVHYI